jgi:hypothetical protein
MGIVFYYIFPLYPIDTCQISAGYVAGIMMPQGFFPLESVHPHTLGIWAEVFMCEYNGYSSNKIYKRCDHFFFLEVAVLWATVMVLLHGCNLATISVKVYTTGVCTLAVWVTNLSQ